MQEILKIDLDVRIDKFGWLEHYKKALKAVLKAFGYRFKKMIVRESPSGRGLHCWIYIVGKPLTEEKRNLLQWLTFDDQTRVWINQMRIEKGIPLWNKMFSAVLWKRPNDPKYLMRLKKRQLVDMYSKLSNSVRGLN